jgi:hypothetical protein
MPPIIIPLKSYKIKGKVALKSNGKPVPYALVEIFDVSPADGNYSITSIVTSPKDIITSKDGSFEASFVFSGISESEGRRPDVIFRVSQTISGISKYIYNENPSLQTRWNIGDFLYVDIQADESAVALEPSLSNQHPGDFFIFTRIGEIPVGNIGKNGYAYPYPMSSGDVASKDCNQPFGGTLSIGGWFGKKLFAAPLNMVYYKIQIAEGDKKPSNPDWDSGWIDIKEPLINYRYDTTQKQWVAEVMGPKAVGSVSKTENLYKPAWNTGMIPWTFPDLLIRLDTTKLKAGLHTLRVKGFDGNGKEISAIKMDPSYGLLKLELDNTLPGNPGFEPCRILSIKHKSASGIETDLNKNECQSLPFSDGIMAVEFEAFDIRGHLREYSLHAYWGHNHLVVPQPKTPNLAVDNYKDHAASLKWAGSYPLVGKAFRIEYKATSPTVSDDIGYNEFEMPSCAYQFRLRVDKRTTNGYGLIYWGYEDNWNVQIKRK